MFTTAIPLALLLGLDGLIVCGALGPVRLGPARRLRLAACFGLCDGLAVFLGSALHVELAAKSFGGIAWFAPLAVGAYGVYVLYLGWRTCAAAAGTDYPPGAWLMYGLPACLSLDNLVAGAAVGGAGLPVVLAAGLSGCVSGLMALAGLWAGEAIGKRLPARPALAGGVALITAAVALVLL
jgi:putative Mn2+ efflux pump MntP